jgi:hypothetical protein
LVSAFHTVFSRGSSSISMSMTKIIHMKFVCSIDEGFLVYRVSHAHILLHFSLPLNYQLPIMPVPEFGGGIILIHNV